MLSLHDFSPTVHFRLEAQRKNSYLFINVLVTQKYWTLKSVHESERGRGSNLFVWVLPTGGKKISLSRPEPEFVKIVKNPGIDSQSGGSEFLESIHCV